MPGELGFIFSCHGKNPDKDLRANNHGKICALVDRR